MPAVVEVETLIFSSVNRPHRFCVELPRDFIDSRPLEINDHPGWEGELFVQDLFVTLG